MPVTTSDGLPATSPSGGTGKENVDSYVTENKGSLAKMFQEGANLISLKKSENLFEQLESRNLTPDEQKIIQERVELQRRMLAAYEKQEKTRKAEDIRSVHPQLSEEEAGKALEMCGNREEEAVASLAEPDFLRRVLAACKGAVQNADPAHRKPRTSKPRKPVAGSSGSQVFVGSFRGKGYPGTAPKHVPAKASTHASRKEEDETSSAALAANGASTGTEAGQEGCNSLDVVDDSVDVGIYGDDAEAVPEEGDGQQRYLLAKELSNGDVRPATTSEVDGLQTRQQTAALMGKHALRTPPSVTSNKPKEHSVEVSEDTVNGAVRILVRQSKNKAIKFLQTMPPLVAERALAVIEEQDPKKAEVLAGAFHGTAGSLAPIEEGAKEEEPDKQPAEGVKEALQKGSTSGRTTRKGQDDGVRKAEPDPAGSVEAGRGLTKSRPTRAAKTKALHGLASLDSSAEWVQEMDVDTIATAEPEARDSSEGKATVLGDFADGSQDGEPVTSRAAAAEKSRTAKTGAARKQKRTAASGTPQQPADVDGGDADKAMAASPVEAQAQDDGKETASSKPKAAISARGHTNRGRVRQKSHKSAELIEVGGLRAERGWYNAGYIFPVGFKSKVNFRSSVELDQLCVHECSVVGKGGAFWPAPTFAVVAMDRPDEPLVAKSCTGCWTAVLKRINAEIEARRGAGEDLPPPPKTAIAGPEYFGFNQAEIQDVVELLDPEHACTEYWQGKADREAHAAGLPVDTSARPPRPRPAAGTKKRRRRGRGDSSEEETQGSEDGDEDETAMMSNKWSAVSRHERYRKRCGGEGDAAYVDEDNPLPGLLDPITLEPVASPAISPWGHVMGMATWKAVLSGTGRCPFTNNSLALWQCKLLTKRNLLDYKNKIVADEEVLKKFGLR